MGPGGLSGAADRVASVLTISEIRARARAFSNEWQGETREDAERQSFWNDWFEVFGISRRRFVTFEHHVRKLTGTTGRIDAFWPGQILIEHKSAGEDLDRAMDQAERYLLSLAEEELPRLIVLSDFGRFRVRNLETAEDLDFPLQDFADRIELFTYLAGYRPRWFEEQDEVNVKAAELMGQLHDRLAASGYPRHELRVLLVRLLFLLFADDTGVWETGLFEDYIDRKTSSDGTDVGLRLGALFQVLNQPAASRQATLEDTLASFPYINGQLFEEHIELASFDAAMRDLLLLACRFNWSKISPAIFGSMFQSVMRPEERHALGAHYTTERNIMKTLGPLATDELRAEFESTQGDRRSLERFHAKLRTLKFFDPACGCGNFLVIAYRELRRLEQDVIRRRLEFDRQFRAGQMSVDVSLLAHVDVDQFYGIEIEEFPARIAEVAMYLMDHLANQDLSREFGDVYVRFPLKSAAHIHVAEALSLDWEQVLPPSQCSYVLGNPPFVAKKNRTAEQVAEMTAVFRGATGHGELDFVAAWFELASRYVGDGQTRVALVATNSITQGEQVPALWPRLLDRGMRIDFAHRTFVWTSEAPGVAAVYVVIIGFSKDGRRPVKVLFDYDRPDGEPHERVVKRINPYLVDGPTVIVGPRPKPLRSVPAMRFGSMPNDGGNLILSTEERDQVEATDAIASRYVRRLLGARDLMSGGERWCLWLRDVSPADLRNSAFLRARVTAVRDYRLRSTRAQTKELAKTPALFGEIRQPTARYLSVPRHGSQNRRYAPMAFAEADVIAHDSTMTIEGADEYLFGILHSAMFMAWLRGIAGRIKGDPRISAELVYNNFPWPDNPSPAARERVKAAALEVLAARDQYSGLSLDALYDPIAMPPELMAAHAMLDRRVDALYGRGRFDEPKRLALLLAKYSALVGQLPD